MKTMKEMRTPVNELVTRLTEETKLPEYGELTFKVFSDLRDFAVKQQIEDEWITVGINSLEVIPVEDMPILADQIIDQYGCMMTTEEMWSLMENEGFLIRYPGHEEEAKRLRYTALRGIRDRAGLNGPAYSVLSRTETAEILNTCYGRWNNRCLVLFRDGAVSAVHSGDANDYVVLPMGSLLSTLEHGLKREFQDVTFDQGFMSHEFCGATFKVEADDCSKVFANAINALGYDPKSVKLYVRFSSSDVALCGANLSVLIEIGGERMQVGNTLSVSHKQKHSLEDFCSNIDKVHALYKDSAAKMDALTRVVIKHPAGCLKAVAKKLGIPKKYIVGSGNDSMSVLDELTVNVGETSTAFEIYYYLWNIISLMRVADATNKAIFDMQENISRAITLNWHDYDYEMEW